MSDTLRPSLCRQNAAAEPVGLFQKCYRDRASSGTYTRGFSPGPVGMGVGVTVGVGVGVTVRVAVDVGVAVVGDAGQAELLGLPPMVLR